MISEMSSYFMFSKDAQLKSASVREVKSRYPPFFLTFSFCPSFASPRSRFYFILFFLYIPLWFVPCVPPQLELIFLLDNYFKTKMQVDNNVIAFW